MAVSWRLHTKRTVYSQSYVTTQIQSRHNSTMGRFTYTTIEQYMLQGHEHTNLKIFQYNNTLLQTLHSCSRHTIHFCPHRPRCHRFLKFNDIFSFLLTPAFSSSSLLWRNKALIYFLLSLSILFHLLYPL